MSTGQLGAGNLRNTNNDNKRIGHEKKVNMMKKSKNEIKKKNLILLIMHYVILRKFVYYL